MSTAAIVHITLDEDGFPGQWIDLHDIGLFSPNELKAIDKQEGEDDLTVGRRFCATVVSAWNVQRRDGTPIPAPTSPDLDPGDLPLRINARLQTEVNAQREELENLKARSRSA